MILSLLAAGAMFGGAPTVTPAKIVSASLFKNGYAVVVREAPLDKSGETLVDTTPASTLGTVWFTTSEGTKLHEVVATNVAGTTEASCSSLDEILAANVGKKVTLAIQSGEQGLGPSRTGTILSADGSVVVLQDGGKVVAIQKGLVVGVTSPDQDLQWKKSEDTTTHALRVKSSGPEGGKLFVVSLEHGLTWAPAYAVDISNDKTLKLTAKGTIVNDLGDIDGAEVRLVTGFPNVPYTGMLDPLTSGQSLDQFVASLVQAATPQQYRGMGGNAGGMMSQSASNAFAAADFNDAFQPQPAFGENLEDLFFYHQPDVKLKKGDRGYYVLFSFEAPFEHVYTWGLGDAIQTQPRYFPNQNPTPEGPGEVWHCLRFKNAGKQPLTTGPASTFKKDELMGQDLMNYVGPGMEAELKVTKALDIHAERSAEEVSREKGAIKNASGFPAYDLVTVKETLRIDNRKSDKVKMVITRDLTGEVVAAEGSPKTTKTVKGLRDVNTQEKVVWTVDVEPGKVVNLTFSYKIYVDAQGR
jgi:hypothetical protein